MLYKTTPACSPEVEAIVTKTIGCAIRVHRALGPGYTEGLYHDAFEIDLQQEGMQCEREVTLNLEYRGKPLRSQRIDLLVEKVLVVELKAVEHLTPVHQAQLLSYMKAGRFKVGLLMNFKSPYLKSTLRRFVL